MYEMEDTDESVEDWRNLAMNRKVLLSDLCNNLGNDHVFMSNPETNYVDNVFVKDENVTMMEKYGYSDSSEMISSGSRLPRLTIPYGMSQNELLDSPVMLPNSQLSPTTGTMEFSPPGNDNSMLKSTSISSDKEQDGDDTSSYGLKPPWPGYPPSQQTQENPANMVPTHYVIQNIKTEDYYQSLAPVQSLADYAFLSPAEIARLKSFRLESATGANAQFNTALMNASSTMKESKETVQLKHVKQEQSSDVAAHKGVYSITKTSEDGYNWRKYGQKQVKGSDYPRSYYKCTHLTCPVKKKVERSHDGEVTEIIYKGAHNHPKPLSSRRSTFGSIERPEGLEIQCSTSVVTDICDPHSNNQNLMDVHESTQTRQLSSTLASHDEEEDGATTQGSLSDDDMETETKRRKKESSLIESALGSRALREPRVIVQIESEIDIVDDGYRWRKYGQKVVKGNPNPRSYYKCTSPGCSVRKHVERASHDLKFVLTTYEGKHNHEVPAARNINTTNSSNGNPPSSSPSPPSTVTIPRTSHLPKAEPQDFIPSFDRKMEYEAEFFRPDYLGSFTCPPSSMYHQMKFPTLPSSGLYNGFGLNHSYTPSVANLSIPLPLNYQLPPSFSMESYIHQGRSLNPVPQFFMGQQMNDSDVKFLRPKQEQRD